MRLDTLTGQARRAALAFSLSLSSAAMITDARVTPAPFPLRRGAAQQNQKSAAEAEGFERGKRLLEAGDAAGAASELKRVAEARRNDAEAWRLLGVAQTRAGKYKDAGKSFEKAVKLNPSDASARAGRAYTLLLLGKRPDAEREALRAAGDDARNADAHYVLAALRFGEDDFVKAEAEADAALKLNPSHAAAARLEANALLNLYTEQGVRLSEQNPVPPAMSAEERRAALARSAPAYEPLRARMRALADRIESLAASNPDLRDTAETLRFYGSPDGPGGIMRAAEVTRKAVITWKPEPGFTEEARRNKVTGVVRLRAVLAADGRVRHIIPVRRLPDGLTEVCVEVARRIRFTPAEFNGKPVSQFVILEYNFNIR